MTSGRAIMGLLGLLGIVRYIISGPSSWWENAIAVALISTVVILIGLTLGRRRRRV